MVNGTPSGLEWPTGTSFHIYLSLMPSYACCRWLLIPVITLHNAEEWITEPRYGAIAPTLQGLLLGPSVSVPSRLLQTGWITVTLVPVLLVLAAIAAGRSKTCDWLVCWVTSVYLANALVPHLLEFAIEGSYTPGVITALLVVIPFAVVLLRSALVEKYVSRRQLTAALVAGSVSLPVLVSAVLAVSRGLAPAVP